MMKNHSGRQVIPLVCYANNPDDHTHHARKPDDHTYHTNTPDDHTTIPVNQMTTPSKPDEHTHHASKPYAWSAHTHQGLSSGPCQTPSLVCPPRCAGPSQVLLCPSSRWSHRCRHDTGYLGSPPVLSPPGGACVCVCVCVGGEYICKLQWCRHR